MPVLAQHSAATPEHGTPHEIVDMARVVLGGIDYDPFSSDYWNEHVVKATHYHTAETNALREHEWKYLDGKPVHELLFVNPPGGLVKEAWAFVVERWQAGCAVFWVGFNLDQMGYLSTSGLFFPGFRRCVLPKRLAFLQSGCDAVASLREKVAKAEAKGEMNTAMKLAARARELEQDINGPPIPQTAPTRNNYLALLPNSPEQVERFNERAKALGAEAF